MLIIKLIITVIIKLRHVASVAKCDAAERNGDTTHYQTKLMLKHGGTSLYSIL